MEHITSFQNTKIKQIKKLRDKRGRERENRFVIDDTRDLERALAQGFVVDYLLFCPALAAEDDHALLALLPDHLLYSVDKPLMEKASYRQNPSAVLAVMESPAENSDLKKINANLILTLVNLQKPGNIGALLRTADAAGFKAVFLVDTALDIYNPNIIRSSTGACFLKNIYTMNTQQALQFFHERDYSIIAAVVDGDRDLFETDFRREATVVLGTEDTGLDRIWIDNADQRVRIPMMGNLSDSLNVSVSGAVFMYEALRQQR